MGVRSAAAVVVIGAFLFSGSTIAFADDFETHPPTDVLSGSTAYTLTAGEFQIGTLDFSFTIPGLSAPFDPSQLRWIQVEYGLTNQLHVGTTVAQNVLQGPNAWSVFTAIQNPTLALAIPFNVNVGFAPFVVWAGSGVMVSWTLTSALDLHSGLRFAVPPNASFQITHIYSAFDLGLAPNTRAVVELDYFPQNTGQFSRKLVFNVGVLTRINFLAIEASTGFFQRIFEPETFGFDLQLELHVRF